MVTVSSWCTRSAEKIEPVTRFFRLFFGRTARGRWINLPGGFFRVNNSFVQQRSYLDHLWRNRCRAKQLFDCFIQDFFWEYLKGAGKSLKENNGDVCVYNGSYEWLGGLLQYRSLKKVNLGLLHGDRGDSEH